MDFVIKEVPSDRLIKQRFKIVRNDDQRVKLLFEQQNDFGRWGLVGWAVLDDDDLIGYLKAAGVKT